MYYQAFPFIHSSTKPCSGLSLTFDNKPTEAGICIHGQNVVLKDAPEHRIFQSVDKRIEHVSITGSKTTGFNGANIAILGSQNTRLPHTTLINGAQYGVLSAGSISTRATHNIVSSTNLAFIGLLNRRHLALRAREEQRHGILHRACMRDNGRRGQSESRNERLCRCSCGTRGTLITENSVSKRNRACDAEYKRFGAGVVVFGAMDTRGQGNTVERIGDTGLGGRILGWASFCWMGRWERLRRGMWLVIMC